MRSFNLLAGSFEILWANSYRQFITILMLMLMLSVDAYALTSTFVPQPWDYIFYTFAFCGVVFASLVILAYKEYRWLFYVFLSFLLFFHAASLDGTILYFVLNTAPAIDGDFVEWVVPFLLTTSIASYGYLLVAVQLEPEHSLAKLKSAFFVLFAISLLFTVSTYFWLGSWSLAAMWWPARVLFFTMVASQFLPPLTWVNYGQKLRFFIRVYPVVVGLFAIMGFSYISFNGITEEKGILLYRYILLLVAGFSLIIVIWQAFNSRHMKDLAAKNEVEMKLALLQSEHAYNEALEAATKHRHQLAMVSHDLKQPITALRSTIEQLVKEKGKGAEKLMLAVDYIDSLSRDYVSYHDDIGVPKEAVNSVVEKVSTTLLLGVLRKMFEADAKSLNIKMRFYTADYQVLIEPLSTMRIMTNVLSNGLNHSKGSKMLIGFRSKGDQLIFQVHDNGSGILEENQSQLMQRGEKGEGSKGDGLGLSIVEEQCKNQGMQFKLCSQQGVGTSVFVVMKKAH
jgi:signal transduction histidine kinase